MTRIYESMEKPSFSLYEENKETVIEGITPLRFVHQMMDIKAMTNTSDVGMEMFIKYITTQVLTWKHNLPTSFYKCNKLLEPRDTAHFKYW